MKKNNKKKTSKDIKRENMDEMHKEEGTHIEYSNLNIKKNTSWDNFLYWANRLFFFWRWSVINIDVKDKEFLFDQCCEKNMCVDQLFTAVLKSHIKNLKKQK